MTRRTTHVPASAVCAADSPEELEFVQVAGQHMDSFWFGRSSGLNCEAEIALTGVRGLSFPHNIDRAEMLPLRSQPAGRTSVVLERV